MTGTEPHRVNRALVASFLFTDLVGFSKGTVADQYAAKASLSAILRSNLDALPEADYRIKDTGDGALIVFLSNPEHALYMALAIAQDYAQAAGGAGFPSNSLRTGLHLGSVKESIDLELRPNFIGDGINAAKRIMDFATPGQITASRAYFEAVACLDAAYAALFHHLGAPDDKHGRAHELYAVAPSGVVLEKLRGELADTTPEPVRSDAVTATSVDAKSPSTPALAGTSATLTAQTGGVRKRFVPVTVAAAVLLGIVATWMLAKPSGPVAPAAQSVTTESARAQPVGKERSMSQERALVSESAAPVTNPATVTTPATETIPAAAGAKASVSVRSATPSPPTTSSASDAAAKRGSLRCSRIVEKAALGEGLSQEEKKELAISCR